MTNWSLVIFTLLTQSAVGLVWMGIVGHWLGGAIEAEMPVASMSMALGFTGLGLLAALAHLAAPQRAPHALRNPAISWLSREVLLVPMFAAALFLMMAAARWGGANAVLFLEFTALLLGGAALWAMTGVYLLKTVPAWNTPATPLEFVGSALLLGGALSMVSAFFGATDPAGWGAVNTSAAAGMGLGLAVKLAAVFPGMAAERRSRAKVWYPQPVPALSAGQARLARSMSNMVGVVLTLAAAHRGWSVGAYLGFVIIAAGEVAGRRRFYRLYGRIGL